MKKNPTDRVLFVLLLISSIITKSSKRSQWELSENYLCSYSGSYRNPKTIMLKIFLLINKNHFFFFFKDGFQCFWLASGNKQIFKF